MLFDHPAPLPVAKVHARSVASFASRLRGARAGTWRWFRPRAAPAAAAIVGMLAVLGATKYLTDLATHAPEKPVASAPAIVVTHTELPPEPVITIDDGPAPATITLDGPLSPSHCQIHLELEH